MSVRDADMGGWMYVDGIKVETSQDAEAGHQDGRTDEEQEER